MEIKENIITNKKVARLLEEHLADMHKVTQPGSVHALNLKEFEDLRVTFWTAWMEDHLLGCIALKELSHRQAEVKSYAFTGHRICCVSGHLKYARTTARPGPCTCGTL